jgi:hypothetical protein
MAMKRLIELCAMQIGAAAQNVGATVDFEVLSLPGGTLIAILLWLHAGAMTVVTQPPQPGQPRMRRGPRASGAGRAHHENRE